MRKLTISFITLICALFLAVGAFADSFYKTGDIFAGAGYSAMSLGTANLSGFNIQGSYFYADDTAIVLQYTSLTGPLNTSISILDAELARHYQFNDYIGAYGAVGIGAGWQTNNTTTVSLAVFELGLELKPVDHIIIGVGYKANMDQAGVSVNGITSDINYVF